MAEIRIGPSYPKEEVEDEDGVLDTAMAAVQRHVAQSALGHSCHNCRRRRCCCRGGDADAVQRMHRASRCALYG